MPEADHRVTVMVAILGVIGTLGAAAISNWDKIFGPSARPAPVSESATSPRQEPPPQPSPAPPREVAQNARPEPPSPQRAPGIDSQTVSNESAPFVEQTPNIGGLWHDSDNPANGTQITQQGTNFRFTRWGVLPNGVQFQSSGGGTITGQRFTTSYGVKYQTGAASSGNCTGTVSPDARRMDAGCSDSLLGTFSGTSIR